MRKWVSECWVVRGKEYLCTYIATPGPGRFFNQVVVVLMMYLLRRIDSTCWLYMWRCLAWFFRSEIWLVNGLGELKKIEGHTCRIAWLVGIDCPY
jgi:hypothetical protein